MFVAVLIILPMAHITTVRLVLHLLLLHVIIHIPSVLVETGLMYSRVATSLGGNIQIFHPLLGLVPTDLNIGMRCLQYLITVAGHTQAISQAVFGTVKGY